MEKEILEKYIQAGRIASAVREEILPKIVIGEKLLSIAEFAEKRIQELGGEPAFPVNISINNVAAHFTPDAGDKSEFRENDVVKIDIGVQVDGYIGDTAATVSLAKDGRHNDLLEASRKALEDAIKLAKPGVSLGEIGNCIENIIRTAGFMPVANLTGHGLEQFNLHAEPQIPNIKTDSNYRLREGQVIAIEPFASTGEGFVKESGDALIYMLLYSQPVRNSDAKRIIQLGLKRNGLPFAKRWLSLPEIKFRLAMRELEMRNCIHPYPILKDVEGSLISQFEHTVIVGEKPIITTAKEE